MDTAHKDRHISAAVVLVTGASSGIGELTVAELGSRGHRVFAGVRDATGRNADAAARLGGRGAAVVELDVTDDDVVRAAVERVVADAGRIDIVVNNAGTMSVGISEAFTVEQAKYQFDVNAFGPIRINRAVLPHMRRQGSGLLVHVSSLAGRVVFPFFGLYCASKYALEALAESYRYELAPLGVDSVIVEPGPFPTNLIAQRPMPRDHGRIDSYGEIAGTPEQLLGAFQSMFEGPDAPRPRQVAEAIAELVATPAGERPLRTVVGADFGVVELNDRTEPIAGGVLEGMGLGHLAGVAAAA